MAEKTKVVFRVLEGEVIALFPDIPWDVNGIFCSSYQHVGQHGSADTQTCTSRKTRPATPEEYAPLKAELEFIGYDLAVRQRIDHVAAFRRRKRPREEKVCNIGPGRTRCYLRGEGWAGKVWESTSNKLAAYVRIEPGNGKRAFSRYVPGHRQADVYLETERPSWMSAP